MPPISALVDSGSSHCFIDSKYVNKHSLETYAIPLLELRLLDSSLNTFVTKATKLNIQFSTGEVTSKSAKTKARAAKVETSTAAESKK